jgi:hypothetical protein
VAVGTRAPAFLIKTKSRFPALLEHSLNFASRIEEHGDANCERIALLRKYRSAIERHLHLV